MTIPKKSALRHVPTMAKTAPMGVAKKSAGPSAKKSPKRSGRFVPQEDVSHATHWDAYEVLENIDPSISPVETIRQLSDIREALDLRGHLANQLLRLTAYKAATDIKKDKAQYALFLKDPFFTQHGPKTKKLENDHKQVLRYAMIRIFGYQDKGRKASKEAIKLQSAFDANEPLSVVRELLSPKSNNKNANSKSEDVSPSRNTTPTFDVPALDVNAVHVLPEFGAKNSALKLKRSDASETIMLLVCVAKSNAKTVQFVNLIEKFVAVSNGLR